MRLIVKSGGPQAYGEWQSLFAEIMPGIEVLDWFNPPADLRGIEYALVWEPEPGRLAALPDLQLIISSGVGVDHILADPQLPAHLPIARLLLEITAIEMREYVLMSVLMLVRDIKRVVLNQARRHWEDFFAPRRSATIFRCSDSGSSRIGRFSTTSRFSNGTLVKCARCTPRSVSADGVRAPA